MKPDQLLSYLADELSGTQAASSVRTTDVSVRRIQNALAQNSEREHHAILAIDEAHLLADMGSLETMRLLLNFESNLEPALTLLLVGQPTLLANLDRMPALEERLGVKCLLRPFTEEETISYVSHRLTAAGASHVVFDQSALERIHALSLGVPRRINRLCDLALLIGFAEELSTISAERIESVSEELVTVSPD
jgi:general secretion pathway protein A